MLLKARYVAPVDGPVILDGGIVVEEGRIVALGPAASLHGRPAVDYGEAVIVPGFVNAHTHLELSLHAGRLDAGPDFIAWLTDLTTILRAEPMDRERVQAAVRQGIADCLSQGVTTIGDITRNPDWTREVLSESLLRSVSFAEVISIGKSRAEEGTKPQSHGATKAETSKRENVKKSNAIRTSTAYANRRRSDANHDLEAQLRGSVAPWLRGSVRLGISPHAPYTVEPETLRQCAAWAKERQAPICIHLLESRYEDAFTRDRVGPLADFLRSLNVWDEAIPVSGCGPVELLEQSGLLGPSTVLAHVNYPSDEDIARIAASGAHVAYCPRTHRAFGHPPHRFREMLAAGINVCIGTDSLASNPSLSVLDELRFLRREYPDFSVEELLAMGTLRGAKALGFDQVTGSVTVGKSADLVVIPLEAIANHGTKPMDRTASAWDVILESSLPPIAVYCAGRPIVAATAPKGLQHDSPGQRPGKQSLR